MDLYLVKGYKDVAATTLADAKLLLAALADPSTSANAATIGRVTDKIESFVQDDNGVPINIYSIDDTAGTASAWVADAAQSISLALGDQDTAATSVYCATASFAITGGARVGTLATNTTELKNALDRALCGRRGASALMTLHVRKTNAASVTESVLMLRVAVTATVLSATLAALNQSSYQARGLSYNASANASGNTTITPAAYIALHTEIVTFSGSGSTTRVIILATTNRVPADRVDVRLALPATSGITVEVRSADATGTLLASMTSSSSGNDAACECVYTGSAWALVRFSYPA